MSVCADGTTVSKGHPEPMRLFGVPGSIAPIAPAAVLHLGIQGVDMGAVTRRCETSIVSVDRARDLCDELSRGDAPLPGLRLLRGLASACVRETAAARDVDGFVDIAERTMTGAPVEAEPVDIDVAVEISSSSCSQIVVAIDSIVTCQIIVMAAKRSVDPEISALAWLLADQAFAVAVETRMRARRDR